MVTFGASLLATACAAPGDHVHGSAYGGPSSRVETVMASDGGSSEMIECSGHANCLHKAATLCPHGYDVLGTGSHRSVTDAQRTAYSFETFQATLGACESTATSRISGDVNAQVDTCVRKQLPPPPTGEVVQSLQLRCKTAPVVQSSSDAIALGPPPDKLLGIPLEMGKEPAATACRAQDLNAIESGDFMVCKREAPGATETEFKLKYCEGVVCKAAGVVSLVPDPGDSMVAYRRAVGEFSRRHGSPSKVVETFIRECRELENFADCLATGEGKAWTGWLWPDGTEFYLKVLEPEGSESYRLLFGYKRGKHRISADPTARVAKTASPEPAPSSRLCIPGQSMGCTGAKGCTGYQVCSADGMSLGECHCE
jgi:hypothetical protein